MVLYIKRRQTYGKVLMGKTFVPIWCLIFGIKERRMEKMEYEINCSDTLIQRVKTTIHASFDKVKTQFINLKSN